MNWPIFNFYDNLDDTEVRVYFLKQDMTYIWRVILRTFFLILGKNLTERIYFFFMQAENFDIFTCYVMTYQNMMRDTSTITVYKNVQEMTMEIIRKTTAKLVFLNTSRFSFKSWFPSASR